MRVSHDRMKPREKTGKPSLESNLCDFAQAYTTLFVPLKDVWQKNEESHGIRPKKESMVEEHFMRVEEGQSCLPYSTACNAVGGLVPRNNKKSPQCFHSQDASKCMKNRTTHPALKAASTN